MEHTDALRQSEGQQRCAKIQFPGRYFRKELSALLRSIYLAGKESKRPTESERKIAYIDYSMGHDFREGFRQRVHGFDAMSISSVVRMKFTLMIPDERRKQEVATLHQYAEAARQFLMKAEARLLELETERGSVILLERERDMAEARARIRARQDVR